MIPYLTGLNSIGRYGLTIFHSSSIRYYVGGGSRLFGTPSQLASRFPISQTGATEDGLYAIDYVIRNYGSSYRSNVQKHIVLFTDEPRSVVSSSTTKLTVLNKLVQYGIILSVVTNADDFYLLLNGARTYYLAAIQISNRRIGFGKTTVPSTTIDAVSPISTRTVNSNAHTNYVDLAWQTGGVAFDLGYYSSSSLRNRTSAVFNKLMFSWGGRVNSSISSVYAPVLVSAINSTSLTTQTGQLVHRFACVASSSLASNISMLVDGKWYSEHSSYRMEQTILSDYPYPHPGSYNFICVANNSIGGDQTLGDYTVPDTPRVYQQYSQFTYIPDDRIHCESLALETRHCVDAVFVIDLSSYSNAFVSRISSLAASLPTNADTCTNRYGLTVYGSSSLSQTVSITTQSNFGTPSQLSSAITSQKTVSDSSASGPKDGYEAVVKVMKEYSFRADVQKKIILFADELREVDRTTRNLTFANTLQLLLTNGITLNTISNADTYHYYYNNSNNRLIGMHYNSRTGIGNYSASCGHLDVNLGVVPSAEYKVVISPTHQDYVELAWRSNGSTFDLEYFKESNSSFCSTLLADIFQFSVIQNYPCTLSIVDYAFTTRTQYPSFIRWQDVQPQVQSSCVDMVFLFDISGSMRSYRSSFRYLANNLPNSGVGCSNKYGLTIFERTASAYTSSSSSAERGGYFYPSNILYSLIPSSFYGGTEDGFVGIQYILDNYRFRTDVVKSIVLLTDEPRSIVQSRYTKSSILSALQSSGVILSVITKADDFSTYGSSGVNVLAAAYVKQTLVGFGYPSSSRSIVDAISPVRNAISNNNTHDNYVDIAWQTGGVAFNLDYFRSSSYYSSIRNSFNSLMYIWGEPAPLVITTLSFEFQGTFSYPSPYQFTCSINNVPHATITLLIEGKTYTETDTNSFSQTLDLYDLSPGTYQYICTAQNSNGGDSKVGEFVIKEPILSPFSQFAYLPNGGRSCNTFPRTNCVDLIFILDISGSINNELNRIADLAGNLPETSGTCNNRYGLVLFGVQNNFKIQNLTSTSLYGTPNQLKSTILSSRGIDSVIGSGPEDGYPAIHAAISSFEFRDGAKRQFVLFADERRQPDSTTNNYTYENTISILLSNDITLSVVSYLGTIQYHNQASKNRLIGMKFFNNIGFGNFSSSENDSDLAIVSTPYFISSAANIIYSYVYLAWDTKGSAFDMRYFYQYNSPYFPQRLAGVFEFAVIQNVPCEFTDLAFNFDGRFVSSVYLYSRWTDITTQIESDCVDMVFLIDRSGSMSSYLSTIRNLAQNLPNNGSNCYNRYGLVSFERTAIFFNISGNNDKFGTSRQLYTALSSFSLIGGTEDGYVGIDAILKEYKFREETNIRKHIVLFTDEPRSIVNSSLTKSYILNKLGTEGFILSVVTDADYIYRAGSTSTRMVATAVVSNSYVGFRNRGSFQQLIDVYSPVVVTKYSSSQHDSYVDLAWKTGGVAFDLAYFASSTSNRRRTVNIFQKLMYSWGTYVPLEIDSIDSEVKGGNIEVSCTTNNVPNVSISLIANGQRLTEHNVISIKTNLSLSSIDSQDLRYICLANNSIGGDSSVESLGIQVEHGPPTNAVLTVQSSTSILVEWSPPISNDISLFTYTVLYSANLFDTGLRSISTGPSTTRVVLMNLTPYTTYSVYIRAVTHFDSNQTEVLTATTFQQAPSVPPQNVTVTVINSTSLLVEWNPPPAIHQNGPIRSYSLSYPVTGLSDSGITLIEQTITVDSSEPYPLSTGSQYQLNNLRPYNLYNINITARNDAGFSPHVAVAERTEGTAPTQSPQNVRAETFNSTAIRITWNPPPITAQNGILTNYQINIEGSTFVATSPVLDLALASPVYPTSGSSSILITNLEEYNEYSFSVIALNRYGMSTPSSIATATTLQSTPSAPPQNVTVTVINSTSLLVEWNPPPAIHQDGPIRSYRLSYPVTGLSDSGITLIEQTITVDSSEPYPLSTGSQFQLNNLRPYNLYNINITARNDAGFSPHVAVAERTEGIAPTQSPQNVRAETYNSTAILITWNPPPITAQNGILTNYQINIEGLTFNATSPVVDLALASPVYPTSGSSSILITNLEEYNGYSFSVIALNRYGMSTPSSIATATTLQSRPSSPPISLQIATIASTSVNISWYPPTPINQNGIITKYQISYQKLPSDDNILKVEILSNSVQYPQSGIVFYILRNLEKETNYSIRIQAENIIGIGVASAPVYHFTRELVPGQVQTLTLVGETSNSITVSWRGPILSDYDSSISAYTLQYGENINNLESMSVSTNENDFYQLTIPNLNSETLYLIRVFARNVYGDGEISDLQVRTNPVDTIPEITNPDSNTTFSVELSFTFNRTIICQANGYPTPTIRWYNNEDLMLTTGPNLYITVRNVTDGIVFICKAENRLGFMSRSVLIHIPVDHPEETLDDINDEINVAEFDPNLAGDIADTIKLALPSTNNISINDVNKTRDILDTGAKINEDLLDKIIENDTAIPLDDAERIVDTAGDIAVKDTELDSTVDTPALTPEAIKRGITFYESDSLIVTLRTIEKVCRNLADHNLNDNSRQETLLVSSQFVHIFGANIPVNQLTSETTLPIERGDLIGEKVTVSKSSMMGIADGEINVKIFVATLNLNSSLLNRKGTGTKHASSIVLVVIPKVTTNITLSKEASILLPTHPRSSSLQFGTYLRGNAWYTTGITTNIISESTTELLTNHFTSFALFDTPVKPDLQLDFYFAIVSYALSAISILFLILSIVFFTLASKKGFFKVEINILYFNLALALLVANGFFSLYGIRAYIFPLLMCKILAGIIHYAWTAVFTWCLSFVIYIIYKLTCGINKDRKIYPYLIIIAWAIPLIFPVFTIAFKLEEYIDANEHCFPSIEGFVVVGLAGPVLITFVLTLLLAVVSSIKFVSAKKRIESDKKRANIKHILISTWVLICFLIVPWIFLVAYILLGYFEPEFLVDWIYLIEWLFVLFNDVMGVVFFFVIVVRNKQVILLVTRKQQEDETEIIQRNVPQRDVIQNPTYGEVNFGAQNLGFNDLNEKDGAEFSIYADIGDPGYEKELMEKKRVVSFNPYETGASVSNDLFHNQMYDPDLPPIYDQVASTSGFHNPVYGMGGEELPVKEEPIYQDMHFAVNPCVEEDLKPEEEPSPIHPTGTRIEKENDYEV